jgi:outer membrane protein OmpA-like peptidoglycan-associated protein
MLRNGKLASPGPEVFLALGSINRWLAEQAPKGHLDSDSDQAFALLKGHPELAGTKVASAAPVAVAMATPAVTGAPVSAVTVFFGVGSAALDTDATKTLAPLVDGLKANAAAKVAISGFHSASGDLAANQELAKRRAFSVRGALTAAGIPEDRMILEKPASTEANLAGEDPRSRRVDVAIR